MSVDQFSESVNVVDHHCSRSRCSYGRFSRSIRPDRCGPYPDLHSRCLLDPNTNATVCGKCKVGRLTPLFTVRSRGTPKTMADSKNAADKPQGEGDARLFIVPAMRIPDICARLPMFDRPSPARGGQGNRYRQPDHEAFYGRNR